MAARRPPGAVAVGRAELGDEAETTRWRRCRRRSGCASWAKPVTAIGENAGSSPIDNAGIGELELGLHRHEVGDLGGFGAAFGRFGADDLLTEETGTDLRKRFPVGTQLDVKVIEIDPRRGEAKLSIRPLKDDVEKQAHQQYGAGVARGSKFGTFADLMKKSS